MNEWAPALAVIAAALFASPWLASWITARERRADKIAEWKRQDLLAARLRRAADDVAEKAAANARTYVEKLDQIHVLVNSNMTATLQHELDARRETLDLLEAALAGASGMAAERLRVTIMEKRAKVAELQAQITDREMPSND